MPHVIVEYSSNLESIADMSALVEALHAAALATGVAPVDALRTRAEPRAVFVVGDGHADNAFVAIIGRFGPGRSAADKERFLNAMVETVEAVLGAAAANVMISVEWQDIDVEFRVNKNNARAAIVARTTR